MLAGIAVPAAAQPGQGDRAVVDGSAPSWASPAAKVGTVPAGERRHIQVALGLRDPRGAEALAKSLSTPGSGGYRKFLSSAEFTARFGPDQSTVDRVSDWLKRSGLSVEGVAANRHFVDAVGTAGQLEAAFGVTLAKYRHRTGDGRTLTLAAPQSPLSVPRAVRGQITAVLGLDDSAQTVTTSRTFRPVPGPDRSAAGAAAGQDSTACARFWGEANDRSVPQKFPEGMQSNENCGYDTAQMRAIYGLTDANTGANTTIAIVGAYASPTVVADANRAARDFGGKPLAAGQFSELLPPSYRDQDVCSPDSWNGEEALDVQASHMMAPGAGLRYYAGSSCKDLFTPLNQAVSEDKAAVITNSWLFPGESSVPRATVDQMNDIALQAAIQGQSVLFASGDSGDNSGPNGHPEASYPASHPLVTAVGGTSVALGADNKVKFATGWENSGNTLSDGKWVPQADADGPFAGGAGGGTSRLYDAPDYQSGVVPAAMSRGKRSIPDISAAADAETGIGIGYTAAGRYVKGKSGGTSEASPVLAGLLADALQARDIDRFGFLNNAIYSGAGIDDVLPVQAGVSTQAMPSYGHVSTPPERGKYLVDLGSAPQTLKTVKGYDQVGGVGTPNREFVATFGK
ncbi:protease pro-enzyme activation domain-containing protein [Amycolatopsis sp. WGS_07]|uniref:S53 family peptidase n=1 Tax=Amycolatopsis sp. WGS_07 TaxID=3076764 RepID=UPI003872FB2F